MSKNAKTALVLASIAAAFFLGIIAKYWLLNG
ncbi:MAG TPA: cytochrome oxidase small assembly protein [Burkholderiales bacterium]